MIGFINNHIHNNMLIKTQFLYNTIYTLLCIYQLYILHKILYIILYIPIHYTYNTICNFQIKTIINIFTYNNKQSINN